MRLDLAIQQLPPTPNFGGLLGKNIVAPIPEYNSKILRVSDASDSAKVIVTADSASAGLWNHDSTMLMCHAVGGQPFLYQLDPVHLKVVATIPCKIVGSPCFSRVSAGILYTLQGTVVRKYEFAKVNGLWTQGSSVTVVCDFAKILPLGFVANWSSAFLVSHDDSTFAAAFSTGVQNTSVYACVFQKGHAGNGYRLLETGTGIATGGWGATGAVNLKSPLVKFPFTMHEFWMTPNATWAAITPTTGNNTQMFWNIGSAEVDDPSDAGHQAYGYLHVYAGGPGGGQIKEVEYATLASRMVIPANLLPANQTPAQHYDGDAHYAISKVDLLDNTKIVVSSQSKVSPFTSCWMNEIRAVRIADGVVERYCPTFNSGLSNNFITASAIGVPDQQNKLVAFASDMMGTLGNRGGDVFVVPMA